MQVAVSGAWRMTWHACRKTRSPFADHRNRVANCGLVTANHVRCAPGRRNRYDRSCCARKIVSKCPPNENACARKPKSDQKYRTEIVGRPCEFACASKIVRKLPANKIASAPPRKSDRKMASENADQLIWRRPNRHRPERAVSPRSYLTRLPTRSPVRRQIQDASAPRLPHRQQWGPR